MKKLGSGMQHQEMRVGPTAVVRQRVDAREDRTCGQVDDHVAAGDLRYGKRSQGLDSGTLKANEAVGCCVGVQTRSVDNGPAALAAVGAKCEMRVCRGSCATKPPNKLEVATSNGYNGIQGFEEETRPNVVNLIVLLP